MTDHGPTAEGLFEAIRNGNDLAVDTAISADMELLRARDGLGRSPILAAASAGYPEMARRIAALLAATPGGLDIFAAATIGDVEAVRAMLTDDRASVDDRGPDGLTALHLAAGFGYLELARLLLGRAADPNAVSHNDARETPLHAAVSARHRDTAGLLMALGASPNVVDGAGRTPLHAAVRNGDEAIVDMLLLRGADPTRAGDDGRTAIELAKATGKGAMAKRLRAATKR
ncbi:MAG: ankyrin repeat domain-containing protein [Candidatus Limnocylindrales bacterium]|jgi:ankyrin repeat protein